MPGVDGGGDVLLAGTAEVRLHPRGRLVGKAEQLVPVATVRVEGRGDRTLQRDAPELWAVHAAEVALDLTSPVAHDRGRQLRDTTRERRRDRFRDDADDLCAGAVREVRRVPDALVQATGDERWHGWAWTRRRSVKTQRGRGAAPERPPASRSARVCGRWAAHHCANPPAWGSSRSVPRA